MARRATSGTAHGLRHDDPHFSLDGLRERPQFVAGSSRKVPAERRTFSTRCADSLRETNDDDGPFDSRVLEASRASRYRGIESSQQEGRLAMDDMPARSSLHRCSRPSQPRTCASWIAWATRSPSSPRTSRRRRPGSSTSSGEFDARGGWNTGFRSCAAWLAWRVGLAPGAAREHVRVARALGTLPALAEALGRGELSYAKVRALTRVATPETEARLLAVGRAGTAAPRRAHRAGLAPGRPAGGSARGRPPVRGPGTARLPG